MKIFIAGLVACMLLAQTTTAQTTATYDTTIFTHKNSFYGELFGASFLGISANYERFLSKQPGGFSLRAGIGIGVLPGILSDNVVYGSLPLGLSYNLPVTKNKLHFIEGGANYIFIFGTKDDNTKLISPIIGYRYQSPSGKFLLRATLFPFLFSSADDDGGTGIPWVGFSLGTRF